MLRECDKIGCKNQSVAFYRFSITFWMQKAVTDHVRQVVVDTGESVLPVICAKKNGRKRQVVIKYTGRKTQFLLYFIS